MLKKLILLLLCSFATLLAWAQSGVGSYSPFSIGAGASYIKGFTNINRQDNHIAENINFSYYPISSYLPITLELQKGTLSGGGLTVDLDKYGRKYTNNYFAAMIHADFQFGFVGDDDDASLAIFNGLYLGTGIGLINDNCTTQRTNVIATNGSLDYVFPGVDKSTNEIVPIRIGYEFRIKNSFGEPFLRFSISYEHNLVFGEGLDGYDDPSKNFKNNSVDQYRQISFGIKYDFGGTGL
jgi:hypothetical protein